MSVSTTCGRLQYVACTVVVATGCPPPLRMSWYVRFRSSRSQLAGMETRTLPLVVDDTAGTQSASDSLGPEFFPVEGFREKRVMPCDRWPLT